MQAQDNINNRVYDRIQKVRDTKYRLIHHTTKQQQHAYIINVRLKSLISALCSKPLKGMYHLDIIYLQGISLPVIYMNLITQLLLLLLLLLAKLFLFVIPLVFLFIHLKNTVRQFMNLHLFSYNFRKINRLQYYVKIIIIITATIPIHNN